MDDAVALAPESLGVLIPRGATLLSYAAHSTDPQRAHPRLEMGLADYEKVLAIQKAEWAALPLHSRGELLSALAAGWLQAGDALRARGSAQRIMGELAGSRYAARAQSFLPAAPPPAQLDWPCLGCHVSKVQ
jgi:acyl transferase domain-containing protein